MLRRGRMSVKIFVTTIVLVIGLAVAAVGSGFAQTSSKRSSAAGPTGTVYVLLPNTTEAWSLWFGPFLQRGFKKYAPGLKLKILNARASVTLQAKQMDTALASGAKAVVLAPHDSAQSGGMLAAAARANVPVINWVNDPGAGKIAYNVGYAYKQMGEAQPKHLAAHFPAQPRPFKLALILGDPKWGIYHAEMDGFNKYLGPLVKNGTIEIVCKYDTLGWVPANAGKNMEQCLTKTGGEVDGIFGHNDDTLTAAWGVVVAQGLQKRVKILNGIDGTLPPLQRILSGQQLVELIPGYQALGEVAAKLTVAAIQKTSPPKGLINSKFSNKFMKGGVPTALVPAVVVTPENFQKTIIDGKLWTKAQLCKTMPDPIAYCN